MIRSHTDTYTLRCDGQRQYLTLNSLNGYAGLVHLFTTRFGGVSDGCCSTWNFGAHDLDTQENILRNYEILAEVMGTTADNLVRTAQTHTVNIRAVTEADGGKGITRPRDYDDVDGLVTDVRGIALITGHADCNAVFFFDPVKQVIGLAHSGWRGTLAGISSAMVDKMEAEYGCRPGDIVTGLGPALCQDCFEVDEDVAAAFFAKNEEYRRFSYQKGSKYYLDLKAIIRFDLLARGILPEHFSDMELCTRCSKDIFFSHRGHQGKRGIMAAAMMLR